MKNWKYIDGSKVENSDGVARMFQGLVKDENKDEKKDSGAIDDLEKVGNKVGNAKSIWELPDGRMATVKEDGTVEIKKKGDSSLYVYKVWDKERAEIQLERKGAKKVGNATFDMTDRDYENEYKSLVQKRNNTQKGTKEYEEIQKRLDEIRKKLGRSPFGNKVGNSEDDKFSYVMREFDEGKLKSSSGETVTNPEQAKAIAYSESKKAENGLVRARKAMKV